MKRETSDCEPRTFASFFTANESIDKRKIIEQINYNDHAEGFYSNNFYVLLVEGIFL